MDNQEYSVLFDIAIVVVIVNLSIIPFVVIFASTLTIQSEEPKQNHQQLYKYPSSVTIQK